MRFQYKRVNRQRTCLICGKPDWCSYSSDGKISFCARIVDHADRISRTGWGVFYHEKLPFLRTLARTPLPFPSKPELTKPVLAPIEIRDFVYRNLIELSPATDSREIIDGPKGLRERGILDFEKYGSLPKSSRERERLANSIQHRLSDQFPAFAIGHISRIARVPGFWINKTGKARLWLDTDYSQPVMLIPYRNANGLIQACQLRFMGSSTRNRSRYLWLSTPREGNGVTSGSPLHFACDFGSTDNSHKPILVTEGALKAQTVQNIRANLRVLGIGGVTCSHSEIVSVSRFVPLMIGCDMDYLDNHFVSRAIAKLVKLRLLDSERFGYPADVEILSWDSAVKGIDEALLRNFPVRSLGVFEWLQLLDETAQTDAYRLLPSLL